MRNVWIIAHREYAERLRTRGFLMTTLMIPLIMGGFLVGSAFLGSRGSKDIRIAVVSTDSRLVSDLQDEMQREQAKENSAESSSFTVNGQSKKPRRILVEAREPGPGTKEKLSREVDAGRLDGYLVVTERGEATRPVFTFASRGNDAANAETALQSALTHVLLRDQLGEHGVSAAEAASLMEPVTFETVAQTKQKDTMAEQVSVSVLFFVMYLVIMLYGMNVARSIIEEKTSRIFEVMLATIRPEALMAGKILGVGSVGLTQVGIWLGMLLLLSASSFGLHVGNQTLHIALSGAQMAFFLIYFALGYLLYSAIAAALGAITNSEQELQQMNMFLVLPLLSCFVLLGSMLASPDSTMARVLALIPLFTPLLMYFRVSLGHPAVWEIVLSLVLTMGTICGVVWVSSRIYRIGVLMYGKRPNVAEIRRWIRYS